MYLRRWNTPSRYVKSGLWRKFAADTAGFFLRRSAESKQQWCDRNLNKSVRGKCTFWQNDYHKRRKQLSCSPDNPTTFSRLHQNAFSSLTGIITGVVIGICHVSCFTQAYSRFLEDGKVQRKLLFQLFFLFCYSVKLYQNIWSWLSKDFRIAGPCIKRSARHGQLVTGLIRG